MKALVSQHGFPCECRLCISRCPPGVTYRAVPFDTERNDTRRRSGGNDRVRIDRGERRRINR
jgi:hypothetical protein